MNQPTVSAIVPCYNGERFLEDAISSVIKQTYEHWEIVLVDDGSVDGSLDKAKALQGLLPEDKLRIIPHPENRGLSATRNTGIAAARGTYIALLDCDDKWLPDHLSNLVGFLETHQQDFVCCTAILFDDRTGEELGHRGPSQDWKDRLPASLLNDYNYIQPSAIAFRKTVCDRVGGFDPNFRFAEDLEFLFRVANAGYPLNHLSAPTCLYRKGAATAMTSDTTKIVTGIIQNMQKHGPAGVMPIPEYRASLAGWALCAAKRLQAEGEGRRAARYLFLAWQNNPLKVKYLPGIIYLLLGDIFRRPRKA